MGAFMHGGVDFMCPAGGEDCDVTVTGSGATAMAFVHRRPAGEMVGRAVLTPRGTQMLVDLGAHLRACSMTAAFPLLLAVRTGIVGGTGPMTTATRWPTMWPACMLTVTAS